jgi:hypothetical protein
LQRRLLALKSSGRRATLQAMQTISSRARSIRRTLASAERQARHAPLRPAGNAYGDRRTPQTPHRT